jgi:hypothetical protein
VVLAGKLPGDTEMFSVCGVGPLGADTDSQVVAPLTPLATAVKLSWVALLLEMVSVWMGGADPANTEVNANELLDDTSAAETTNVAFIVTGLLLAPVEASVMVPLYCPGARFVKADWFTEAVTPVGVVALAGETNSQLMLLAAVAV